MAAKAIFITGTTTGIGLATAKRFDALGWRVFAGALPGEDTSALQQGASERLTIIPIDITKHDQIVAAEQRIRRSLGDGGLDGLHNNAGIPLGAPMEIVPMIEMRRVLEVNLLGHIAVTQAFLPLIRKNKGRIVNTISILGRVTTAFGGPYCISKHGMEAFTDALRQELAPWGIHVAGIEPGTIGTPIWAKTIENTQDMIDELPPGTLALYGERIKNFREMTNVQARNSSPPEMVAACVEHAMTAARPKTRYLVGKNARILAFARWLLPDRTFDRILASRTGVK